MALTKVTYSMIQGALANIQDFGAVGDNATDNTTAFNNAIAAMNAGDFQGIYIPEGIYRVTGELTTITAYGASIIGATASEICRIVQTSGTSNTFIFSPVDPSTGRISGVCLENFTLWNSSTAPTAGVGVTLIRADRSKFTNVDIRGQFKGLEIIGGADQLWTNIDIGGSATWAAETTGSRCVVIKGANYGAVYEQPGEIFFSNFNFKGAGNTGYLHVGLEISAGDGLWFSNGHVGFSNSASCLIQNEGTGFYIQNLEFNNVYFDGNNAGSQSIGVAILQGAAYGMENIKFNSCCFQNHTYHGIQMVGSGVVAKRIRIEGGVIQNNQRYGVIIGEGGGTSTYQNVSIIGTNISNNNSGNNSADAIKINGGTVGVRVQNCLIEGQSYNYVYGVDIASTAQNIAIENNQFYKCTTNILNNGATVCKYGGNQLQWAAPTAASAASLPLPQGFDAVTVTGTTNITSITGANIANAQVTLLFTGVLTVVSGSNIGLSSAGNFTTATGATLQLINDGTVWREISRATP